MAIGFYNPYDQQVYDAGFKYIPQTRYLFDPFKIPANDPTTTSSNTGGITTLPRESGEGGGGGDSNPYNTNMGNVRQDYNAFPSRQAGEIYSKTFNPRSTTDLNLIKAQNLYNLSSNALAGGPSTMKLNNMGMSMKDMSPGQLEFLKKTNADFIDDARMKYATEGQYADQYDPNYSSMTEAQKFMDNYPDYYGVPSGVPEPGIPGAIKGYMKNSLIGRGLNALKGLMPINQRAIMENEARGAGIFTDDMGRIVTDDYNTSGGIMAGYNLNQIDEGSFGKRRGTIENTLGSKYGLTAGQIEAAKNDPNYTGPGANLVDRLGLLDDAEEDILDARERTKQIFKMGKDKKAADKKRKEAAAAEKARLAAIEKARLAKIEKTRLATIEKARMERVRQQQAIDEANYRKQQRITTPREGERNSPQNRQQEREQAGPGYSGRGTAAEMGSFMDGGRVYYMDGGLADMLEIYD
jgi:hypothetical protein